MDDKSELKLDEMVLSQVMNAHERMTPQVLRRRVKKDRVLERGQFKAAVRRLVQRRKLVYTYQFGNTFLEPCFDKAVRITDAIVLKPPESTFLAQDTDVVVEIRAGAAFGFGHHPTTRLSLKGLEKVCKEGLDSVNMGRGRVLDIGTGSGVLAIAALKLGLAQAIGLDIDPCARVEARQNADINGVAKQIEISNHSIDSLSGGFAVVIANLRFPTLKAYFPRMVELVEPAGFLITSGIKSNEINSLKTVVKKHPLDLFWMDVEKNWAALVVRRTEVLT